MDPGAHGRGSTDIASIGRNTRRLCDTQFLSNQDAREGNESSAQRYALFTGEEGTRRLSEQYGTRSHGPSDSDGIVSASSSELVPGQTRLHPIAAEHRSSQRL